MGPRGERGDAPLSPPGDGRDGTGTDGTYMVFPGSEPIQFDMEKLFLPSVSKENFEFRVNI